MFSKFLLLFCVCFKVSINVSNILLFFFGTIELAMRMLLGKRNKHISDVGKIADITGKLLVTEFLFQLIVCNLKNEML